MKQLLFSRNIPEGIISDEFLLKLMTEKNLGVMGYVIIDDNRIVEANTLAVDQQVRLSKNSLFQACSLRKFLTACAILELVFQGLVDLDKGLNLQLKSWQIPENSYDS